MDNEDFQGQIVVRKRRDDDEEDHHGGVWKLAFADFMTAMMAFFLVMWLINSTTKETKAAIVQYFNPVQLVNSSLNVKGLRDPSESGQGKSNQKSDFGGENAASSTQSNSAVRDSVEAALHEEPLKILDKLAEREPSPRVAPQILVPRHDVFEDPFDRNSSPANTAEPAPKAKAELKMNSSGEAAEKASSDPILKRRAGSPGDASPSSEKNSTETASGASEDTRASALDNSIAQIIRAESAAKHGAPQFTVSRTDEGLLINLTDNANFSMFRIGSIEPRPQLVRIVSQIGQILTKQSGDIEIRGHTDGRSFKSSAYDNWRLSSDRANVVNYMLQRGGLPEARVLNISGYADHRPKTPADPNADVNRRIEILIHGAQR